jgi:hypothetical protein
MPAITVAREVRPIWARKSSWRPIMKKLSMLGIIGGAAFLAAAPLTLQWSHGGVSLSVDSADARVARRAAPLSVAGVPRRAYRRAARSAIYAGTAGGIGYGVGSYYGGYGYPGYSYSAPVAPYYGAGYGYGSYYGGYGYPGYSTAPYNPGPSFGFGFGFGWPY